MIGKLDINILVAAKEVGIPVFVPGWEDSTLGNIFASYCIKGEVNQTAVKSGIQYMMELTEWYKSMSEPIGFLQLGGGIAGDFPICVVPMLNQDLGEQVSLWSWFGQISESSTSFGGYSGAPPNEKISWGKIGIDTPRFVIESDATIMERSPLEKISSMNELMAYKHPGFWHCMDTKRDKDFLEELANKKEAKWI